MRPFLLAMLPFLFLAACTSGSGLSGPGLYIALGDSISEGVGASEPDTTGFVARVRQGLGEGLELMNIGDSGDTSSDLLNHAHLEQAVAEVEQRNNDDDPDNNVKLVTLEIGGNDLLGLLSSVVLPGTCTSLEQSLAKPECVNALNETLDHFSTNLATALDRLREADPDLTIVLMTLYNPFGETTLFGLFSLFSRDLHAIAELALEGQRGPFAEGLNDIIRGEAEERGLMLVDWHPLFEDKANEYIARDRIHPNDAGYEVMAEAVLEAVR